MSPRARLLSGLALAPGLAAFLLFAAPNTDGTFGLDYEQDAATSVSALAHGDLHGFFAHQPLMGSFTLLLRAPLVRLAPAGNLDAAYALGVLACLVAGLVVARLVRAELVTRWGADAPAATLVPALALIGAPTLEALIYGHPEEPLGALLLAAAAIATLQRRATAAGVLLGLACATKPWAAFAVLPVLAAAPGMRVRLGATAAAVAGALTVPMWLGDPHAFGHTAGLSAAAEGVAQAPLSPLTIFSWLGHADPTGRGFGDYTADFGPIGALAGASRPLMALAVLAASAWLLAPGRRPEDLLRALALVLLVRCAVDPVDNVYYHAPFLLALATWEGLRRPGPPVLALASTGALGLIALLARTAGDEIVLAAVLYAAFAAAAAASLLVPGHLAEGVPRSGDGRFLRPSSAR